MLKPNINGLLIDHHNQPPSGGCVLKQIKFGRVGFFPTQPPSGGCVLKQASKCTHVPKTTPAAFRRLCVETPRR